MTDPPAHGRRPSETSRGPEHASATGRGAVLLIAFIIASAVLLGQVHPTASTSTTATAASTGAAPASSPGGKVATTPTTPTTTTTVPPPKVPVVVANGSNVAGAAGSISTEIRSKGWQVLPAENATANVAVSNVYYLSGAEPSATAVAAIVGIPSSAVQPFTSSVPVGVVGTAQVVVVVGPDVASKIGTASATSTTTSVATTTTTKAKAKSR